MRDWLMDDLEIFWWKVLLLVVTVIVSVLLVGVLLLGLWVFKKQDKRLYPADGKMISESKTRQLLASTGVKIREPLKAHPDGKLLSGKESRKLLKEIGIRRKGRH